MKRVLGWLIVIPLLLAACSQPAAQTGQPVEVTRIVEVTRVVEVTPVGGGAP
ncbi:MAG: amino acid ABC transporter substrate-binding protein, partial [Roseiflexus castenholzii]